VTPNEHDNPTTAHEPEDGAEHADASDGQFGEHLSSDTDPAASAGDTTEIEVAELLTMFVPGVAPKETPVVPVRLLPKMVTVVPPLVGPTAPPLVVTR